MGRKLSISQPTVLHTELAQLTDNFWLEPNGSTEQWYYENTEIFQPDRTVIPLIITARISAVDKETNTAYTPVFSSLQWKYKNIIITPSTQGFTISGNTLIVQKNVKNASNPINITCNAKYIDPRDSARTYEVTSSILLTSNTDATAVYPTIDVLAPSTTMFNPLSSSSSLIQLKATVDWANVPAEQEVPFSGGFSKYGTELLLPANDNEVETAIPIVDISYASTSAAQTQASQQFAFRKTGGNNFDPPAAYNREILTKIQGNTVLFNQLVPPFVVNNQPNAYWHYNEEYMSFESYDGHSIILSAMGATAEQTKLTSTALATYGHKYYLGVRFNNSSTSMLRIECIGDSTHGWQQDMESVGYASALGTPQPAYDSPLFAAWLVDGGDGAYTLDAPVVFDLTEMFGAGNEPSTTTEFENWLKSNIGLSKYYKQKENTTFVNTNVVKLISTKLNQWDEQWEVIAGGRIKSKNPIRVLPSTSYFFCLSDTATYSGTIEINEYDVNGNFVQTTNKSPNTSFFTQPQTCFLEFILNSSYGTTYNNEICINISNSNKNGEYEEYSPSIITLNLNQLTGKKAGATRSTKIFPNGMMSAGEARDEIKYEDDVLKAFSNIQFEFPIPNRLAAINSRVVRCSISSSAKANLGATNYICNNYQLDTYEHVTSESSSYDKTFCIYEQGDAQFIAINDGRFIGKGMWDILDIINNEGTYVYYERLNPIVYNVDPLHESVFEWYITNENGRTELAENAHCYVKGQHSDTLVVDALYGENIKVILALKRKETDTNLLPMREYRNITWQIPPLDSIVLCNEGNAVRNKSGKFVFKTIHNTNEGLVSDEVAKANLRNQWFLRNATPRFSSSDNLNDNAVEIGWGAAIEVDSSNLYKTYANQQQGIFRGSSKLVYSVVHLLGAYEPVTYDGEEVTFGEELVYGRGI